MGWKWRFTQKLWKTCKKLLTKWGTTSSGEGECHQWPPAWHPLVAFALPCSTDKMGVQPLGWKWRFTQQLRKNMQTTVDKIGVQRPQGKANATNGPQLGIHWWHLPSPRDVVPHFVSCFLRVFPRFCTFLLSFCVNVHFQPKAWTPVCQCGCLELGLY